MSRLLLIFRRQVICVVGVVLIFLLGTHSVARAFMYSIDGASPSVPGVSGADILTEDPSFSGPAIVAFTAVSLGLVATDEIDALSFGPAFLGGDVLFSVDRASAGVFGTAVESEATAGQAAGDTFITPLGSPGTNIHDFNQDELGLLPAIGSGVPTVAALDNLDAWDDDGPGSADFNLDGIPDAPIFFSLAAGSTSLAGLSATPGDILMSVGGVSSIAVTGAAMGLGVDDDIDALLYDPLAAGGPVIQFSLSTPSPTLAFFGFSAADILVPGPPFGPALFGPTSGTLGLLFDDNLNAFDLLDEGSPPIPEPATVALLGIGLVGLAGAAARRRFRQSPVSTLLASSRSTSGGKSDS